MQNFGRLRPVVYAVIIAIGACTVSPVPLPRPTTTDELLVNLRAALSDESFFDNSFYTAQNLKQFFGGTEVTKEYVADGKPKPFTRFYINGFSTMVPPMPLRGGKIILQGLRADIVKVTEDGRENGKIVKVMGFLEIHSDAESLTDDRVMSIFGYPWTEDRRAENSAFMAIGSEPFNPRAKPQHIMHYVWTQDGYKKEVVLNFGAGVYLWTLNFSVVKE